MKRVRRIIRNIIAFFFISTILSVLLYRFVPVYITPLMLIRYAQGIMAGEKPRLYHRWVSLEDMSRWLPQAVVASEDNLFLEHSGFDFQQIKKAIEENKTRKRPRAGTFFYSQRIGGLFYIFDRTVMGKETDYGSVSELYRNGQKYIWCGSCSKISFWNYSPKIDPITVCSYCGVIT